MFFTPLDIQNAEFKKSMYGYSDEEVDMFLDKVMNDYQEMKKEIDSLQSKISILNNGMQQYKNMETSLKETLILAQQTAEEVKEAAVKKADAIVREAELKSDEIIQNSRYRLFELNRTLKEMRLKALAFKSDYASALKAELEVLDSLDLDFDVCDEFEPVQPVIEAEVKAAEVTEEAEEINVNDIPEETVEEEVFDNAVEEIAEEAAAEEAQAVEATETAEDTVEEYTEDAAEDASRKFFRRKPAERKSTDMPSAKNYKSRFLSDDDSEEDNQDDGQEDDGGKKSDLKKWFLDD